MESGPHIESFFFLEHAEAFFASVENWISYSDPNLVKNRIQALELLFSEQLKEIPENHILQLKSDKKAPLRPKANFFIDVKGKNADERIASQLKAKLKGKFPTSDIWESAGNFFQHILYSKYVEVDRSQVEEKVLRSSIKV